MANRKYPSSEEYNKQVEAYHKEIPAYETFARALKRVLENACRISIPEAIVQTRPKDISSFAAKWVLKYDRYPDPIEDMTDLCGGRVIVQTLEQVQAVCQFIEHNFKVLEKDDKGLLLGESVFGYRDMHYLIRLKEERAGTIGFSPEEREAIKERTAELQVRTWVQHAWADTLHDRLYKAPLRLSQETKREGALLAAIMENGDRTFNRLSLELDGMAANYTAYAGREDVQKEVDAQELIYKNEPDDSLKKPIFALRLSRLLSPGGDYDRVVELLDPYRDLKGPVRPELLLELGHALCRKHRGSPASQEYCRGQAYLEEVKEHSTKPELTTVPDLRKQKSLHARSLYRLAWSWEAVEDGAVKALRHYRVAVELEPDNPYYLASKLGYEIYCSRSSSLIQTMRGSIKKAVETCRDHALAGTELPYAFFAAGRLSLLLEDKTDTKGEASIGWYTRGLYELYSGTSCAPPALLEDEMQWLRRISFGKEPSEIQVWIKKLISISREFQKKCGEKDNAPADQETLPEPRVLIIAGGAASIGTGELEKIRPLLKAALKNYRGKVISGGTRSGVPGCVGEVTEELKGEKSKNFSLVGYLPSRLPWDAPFDERYDDKIIVGKASFTAEQILKNWEDFLREGIEPEQVLLIGFGGGKISSIEYLIALALGASVLLVQSSGGEAYRLLSDPVWKGVENLYPVPADAASLRAFVCPAAQVYPNLDDLAKILHEKYLDHSSGRLPPNLRPWQELDHTFKRANYEQAKYAVEILRAVGFEVRPSDKPEPVIFNKKEIECMAALEHGRWNMDRLKDGWRPGKIRDDSGKIHNCLVPWRELPEIYRKYDRESVSIFPELLAKAGLEIYRLEDQEELFRRTVALLDC